MDNELFSLAIAVVVCNYVFLSKRYVRAPKNIHFKFLKNPELDFVSVQFQKEIDVTEK